MDLFSSGACVVFIANTLRYTPRVRALYRTRTALAITVNDLHVFLSLELWSKKENVRSKGSESGKRCTRACTFHVASGVENGQAAPPFAECGTLSYFRRCASSSLRLGLFTGLSGVVACRFPSLSIPRSLFFVSSL